MAQNTIPTSIEPGQRSQTFPYIPRFVYPWFTPGSYTAEQWRRAVRNQPFAMACRDTLIMNVLSLEWMVTARDASRTKELQAEIEHYTDVIQNSDGGPPEGGYLVCTDKLCQDYLDISFGGVGEVGRLGDQPEGEVQWIIHVDGGTCFPTYNPQWPVAQRPPGYVKDVIPFPKHAVARMYSSPRPELLKRGYGMAPPERIYLALQLISRGDRYYADLFTDTPEVGVLDLGDMSRESAEAWLEGWRSLLTGVDPFKIPVLYEHTKEAKFISFTRSPVELMFDKGTLKYAAIVAAGYGMTLSDIGDLTLGSNSLAGQIRSERKTRHTGVGMLMAKVAAFWNSTLPSYLVYKQIDRDDETLVAKGRARLANAMAMRNLTEAAIINEETAQRQLVADGLVDVPITDTPPKVLQGGENPATYRLLGKPVPASKGGEGEVTARFIERAGDPQLRKLGKIVIRKLDPFVVQSLSGVEEDVKPYWLEAFRQFSMGEITPFEGLDEPLKLRTEVVDAVRAALGTDTWWQQSQMVDRVAEYLWSRAAPTFQQLAEEARNYAYEEGLSDAQGAEVRLPPEEVFKQRAEVFTQSLDDLVRDTLTQLSVYTFAEALPLSETWNEGMALQEVVPILRGRVEYVLREGVADLFAAEDLWLRQALSVKGNTDGS